MKVLHIINNRQLSKANRKYIDVIINCQKKNGIKAPKFRRFIFFRYINSRMLFSKYKLIHLHEPGPLIRLFFLFISRFDSVPLVLSFYNPLNSAKIYKWKINKWAFERLITKSKIIFFNDVVVFAEAKKIYKKASSKFFLVERGCEINRDESEDNIQLRLSYIFRVLNDTSESYNDTLNILEAFSYLPKKFKLLLSDNYKDFKKDIEGSVSNLGLSNCVEFNNYDTKEDVLIDLTHKNLSSSTLQSLCNLTPVVGFRTDIQITGYYSINEVPPKKISTLIKSIQLNPRIVDSKALKRMYSWESRASQYKAVYEYMR